MTCRKLLRSLATRAVAIAAMAWLAFASPAIASQSNLVLPVAGPMSMGTFVGTYLNPALLSVGSCQSGATPPANGPSGAAFSGECWWDTSTTPWVLKFYDGTSWVSSLSLNASTHTTIWTNVVTLTNSQNGSTTILVTNASAAGAALATFGVSNGTGSGAFGIGGTGYTGITLLQNRLFLDASAASGGIVINNEGGNPTIFSTSNVQVAQILLGLQVGTTSGDTSGVVNVGVGFRIGNVPLAASNLSNGVSGSGAIALVNSPTFTGTVAMAAITVTTINGITISASSGTLTLNTNTLAVGGSGVSLVLAGVSGTMTFQGTDTYVGRATTDTLTNKTLTAPTLTGTTTAATINASVAFVAANDASNTGAVGHMLKGSGGTADGGLIEGASNQVFIKMGSANTFFIVDNNLGTVRLDYGIITPGAWSFNADFHTTADFYAPNLPTTTGALAAALCWTVTTGKFQRDTNASGCLVSAREYKHDIETLTSSLDVVSKMRAVSFTYNDELQVPGLQEGFIADEMALVDRNLVGFNPDGSPRTVKYLEVSARLVGAIQELKVDRDLARKVYNTLIGIVTDMQADNDNMRDQLGDLRDELATMKRAIAQ